MKDVQIDPIRVCEVPRLALREAEAAEALGVSPSWLRREAVAGNVPSIKVSGARLFPIEALRAWLVEQAQGVER